MARRTRRRLIATAPMDQGSSAKARRRPARSADDETVRNSIGDRRRNDLRVDVDRGKAARIEEGRMEEARVEPTRIEETPIEETRIEETRIEPSAHVREVARAVADTLLDPDGLHPPQLFLRARAASAEDSRRSLRARRWRQIFEGAGPREILARIVPDDPLGVRAVVARRLQAQAFLVEADRAHVRSLALIARWAPRYDGQPELDVWLEHLVDRALAELAGDDLDDPEACETARDGASAGVDAFETLARPLQLHAGSLRSACRNFNRRPPAERRAFFELVLRHRSLDEVAREAGRNAIEVARQARRALEVFASAANAAPPPSAKNDTECSP